MLKLGKDGIELLSASGVPRPTHLYLQSSLTCSTAAGRHGRRAPTPSGEYVISLPKSSAYKTPLTESNGRRGQRKKRITSFPSFMTEIMKVKSGTSAKLVIFFIYHPFFKKSVILIHIDMQENDFAAGGLQICPSLKQIKVSADTCTTRGRRHCVRACVRENAP